MTLPLRATKMQLLCDAAESVLRSRRRAMHYTELADVVFAHLDMTGRPAARLNTVLHDDRSGRFRRTGSGMWDLAAPTTTGAHCAAGTIHERK
jgi:HB1, ASXL, restriction endonuclease HTH domain